MKYLIFNIIIFISLNSFPIETYDTLNSPDGKILIVNNYENDVLESIERFLLSNDFVYKRFNEFFSEINKDSLSSPTYSPTDSYVSFLSKHYHGAQEYFHSNGELSSRIHYYKGKKISSDTCWHENGSILFINTYNKNGKLHGSMKSYDEKGNVKVINNYLDGRLQGKYTEYFSDGKKNKEGVYKNGINHSTKNGWWCEWFEDGTLKDSTLYNNDYIKESFIYYKNGQLSTHTWVLTIKSDTLPNDEHLIMLEDSYTIEGKLVSQVRNGNGYTHFYDYDGNYTSLMPYKNGKPAKLVSFLSEISKEKLIKSKDPRYPPKEIPKKKQLPFDVKKYGKLLKEQ